MSSLTKEQRKKMEENRLKALERRALKAGKKTLDKLNITSVASNFMPSSASTSQVFPNLNSQLTASLISAPKIKGRCELLSRYRFCVKIAYHKDVVDIFRATPSRRYDLETKTWNFLIHYHDTLISLLKPLRSVVMVIPLPSAVVKICKEEKKTVKDYDLSSLDQTLVKALLQFQKIGVYFGIQHGGRILLADDMGLGKTIQGIAIANYFKNDWPLLVVTPSSVRYSWLEAFKKWMPSVGAHEISVINSSIDIIPDNIIIIIISYDTLTKLQATIISRKYKSIIFDESHFLKNYKSARTKAAQAVMKSMKHIIMLSGTPVLSRPIELFAQISALCPEHFSNVYEYGMRYCNGRSTRWGMDFYGSSNMTELKVILEDLVMIRRLKSEVIAQLPSKSRQMIVLDPSKIGTRKEELLSVSKVLQSSFSGMEKRDCLLKYFHETGTIKIPAVCEYVLDLLECGKKFLCFAHHQAVINSICDCIEKKKIDFIRIDGSVTAENRKNLCNRFQTSDACKVAVLSIVAANSGITLTAASLVVFAELFWNPGILIQAEDRAHRIGQKDSVVVQYLIAKNTADDEMWPLVQRKLSVLNRAGLSKDNFMSADTIFKKALQQSSIQDEIWSELSSNFVSSTTDSGDVPEKRAKLDL